MVERHLRFFVVTAEEEHFQRAANRLFMTQSALSRRIQVLEEELGIKLFERLPRGVRLSQAGESFYQDVRNFRDTLDNAIARARNVMHGNVGQLKIGLNPSGIRNPAITEALQIFHKKFEYIDIKIDVLFSEEQLAAIQSGDLDVGALYQFSTEPWASYFHIADDELLLAIPKSHPLASKPNLCLQDLADVNFIWPMRRYSPRMYNRMIAACNAGGLTPKIMTEVRSAEAVLSMVAIGLAVGFVGSHEAGSEPDSVAIRRVADFSVTCPLSLAWNTERATPALQNFITVLTETIDAKLP
ncbi:MAG: LysR family transcriptional regulator [Sphingomonadaceae bacterium]|nr:LysR family transcriptional regulator [Sphingomonadaceae bacterium]